jgi:transaldolase
MKIDLYADGANEKDILFYNKQNKIKGLTTNPSLMKKSGIRNYELFARKILKKVKKPISFEVFSDNFDEMYIQAVKISSWGKNVFVKIPITNSRGESSINLIRKLSKRKIKLNITAIFTFNQISKVVKALDNKTSSIVSIFAGRIADTGRDPEPFMKYAYKLSKNKKKIKILWASTREVINIYQAKRCKSHIITVPTGILKKTKLHAYSLKQYSKDTVKEFYKDALAAGYKI